MRRRLRLLGSLLFGHADRIRVLRFLITAAFLASVPNARAYSVLTHEAIVDTLWKDSIVPVLKVRFPNASPDDLLQAHAYAYGGCIIQDLGYYPFGSHLFSDLTHYVRSADFIQALVDQSNTLDEYAFALGAAAHYAADVDGHRIAVNRSVPILYPKLRRKYGNEVTYADNPAAHLKTEFGFDVLQVARGHYAPKAYHDFIGFEVSKDLMDRAFEQTYGLKLKDVFKTLDLSLSTYRFSVKTMIPKVTSAAWALRSKEITQNQPNITRKQFLYNISKTDYTKEWGDKYQKPSFAAHFVAFCLRLVPKVGPFRGIAYKVPTPETEKMFEDSFDAAVKGDQQNFAKVKTGRFQVENRDLDTGKEVSPGEYKLTDQTYDKLLLKLASKHFDGVDTALRDNILGFYARMKTPDPHGTAQAIQALKNFQPASPTPAAPSQQRAAVSATDPLPSPDFLPASTQTRTAD